MFLPRKAPNKSETRSELQFSVSFSQPAQKLWDQLISNKVSNAALTCEFGLTGHLRVLMDQPRTLLCEHTEMSLLMQTLAGFQKKTPQIS